MTTTTDSGVIRRTEQLAPTGVPATVAVTADPPVSAIVSQLDRLTAVVGQLALRMDANDRRGVDTGGTHRPPPEPPFTRPIVPSVAWATPPPVVTTIPQLAPIPHPLVTSQYLAGFHGAHTLTASHTMPPFSALDAYGAPVRSNQQTQAWIPDRQSHRPPERPPLSRPQMINPWSSWAPPASRPQFPAHSPDQFQTRGRMDPPRFDGSDANNWIRGIQYYFDHVGTPENQRLHLVIPLFDPAVADWIWNYCSSHEFVSWYEFLDDVRHRFDPSCYQSFIGRLSKLTQTGTVSEYQSAFESLQNRAVGLSDQILLEMYVAGLREPLRSDVELTAMVSRQQPFHAGPVNSAAIQPDYHFLGCSAYLCSA